MNAVATPTARKSRTVAQPQNEAPAVPWWGEPTANARDAVSTLLTEGNRLDLPDENENSDYALRLLDLAVQEVDEIYAHESQNQIAEKSFNCVALLRATLVHPDGTFDIRRRTWVQHSISILEALAHLHMSGEKDGPAYVPTLEAIIAPAATDTVREPRQSADSKSKPLNAVQPEPRQCLRAPHSVLVTNLSGARVFRNRQELEDFAVEASSQVAGLMTVIGSSEEDTGFIKSSMQVATDLAFQVEQATSILRGGTEPWQFDGWLVPMEQHINGFSAVAS